MTCIHRRNGRRLASLRTKRTLLTAAVTMGALLPTLPAQGAPDGGEIRAGSGSISQQGNTTTITQAPSKSPQPARMVIDWNGFSSSAAESIVFNQPNASAVVLNRITGANPSQLLGNLTANGQVFILNPNGVLFGPGSQVSARGFLASTLDMNIAGFAGGTYVLQGTSSGKVVNQGNLKSLDGGYIALIGQTVVNAGNISARKGDALLATGEKVTLQLEGGSLINYNVDVASAKALVENTAQGTISATGGRVVLAAAGADALIATVVNNAGLIEAQTLEGKTGSIKLLGDPKAGNVQVSGILDASSLNAGDGGSITTSGAKVSFADSARITTANGTVAGKLQIDAINFDILGSGNQSDSSMSATTLSAALSTSNVDITSRAASTGVAGGDINVYGAVKWSANKLTLRADRNINFNAPLAGNNVALMYGQASSDGGTADFHFDNGATIDLPSVTRLGNGSFTTQKGNNPNNEIRYLLINSLGAENGNLNFGTLQGTVLLGSNFNYALSNDISAAETRDWNKTAGFTPLEELNGRFEGLGHKITDLTINKPGISILGLFSSVGATGIVRNLGLTNVNIVGNDTVGALAGTNLGTISNVYVTGKVNGIIQTGGLIGINSGMIINSYSLADVAGNGLIGGLVGINDTGGIISQSYATGQVTGESSGAAKATYTGGLTGFNQGDIAGSYATGNITGLQGVGGLTGANNGNVEESYASGSVEGKLWVGGLAGVSAADWTLKNSYSTGRVNGKEEATTHGLVGFAATPGTVLHSYWNTDAAEKGGTGQTAAGIGEGKTGAQLRQAATFAGWDMSTNGRTSRIWRIYEGNSMPLLRSFLAPLALASSRSMVYAGATLSNPAIQAAGVRTGTAASGRNVGTYQPFSNQQGYDISGGDLVITPRALQLTAGIDDKVYDGKLDANATLRSTQVLDSDLTIKGVGAFDDKNVGNGKKVVVSGITLGGDNAGNYSFEAVVEAKGNVTPLNLELAVSAKDKVYNGTTDADASVAYKKISGDKLDTSFTANFNDKNAGEGKTVTLKDFTLTGADAGNYTFTAPGAATAAITKRLLTVTASAADKVYDGSIAGNAILRDNRVLGDSLTTNASATFENKNVGIDKKVSVSGITITGTDAGNYQYQPQVLTTAASITPRSLTVTATAADKVYDGTTSAAAVLKDNRIAGDALTANALASFDDKNAATGKTVTVSGVSITGADAANYRYQPEVIKTTASITPRSLDLTATAADKAYDGSTRTSAVLFDNRVAGDSVTANYRSADYADKNAGVQKLVTVSGVTLTGVDAANYEAGTSITTLGSISPVSLVISANADKRDAGGLPYKGGNGVTYAGFVPGETPAVLGGQLRYGGSAQGAVKEGSYRITPGGVNSVNYASTFVDGTLTIQAPLPGAILASTNVERSMPAPLAYAGRTGTATAMRVADCGVRMPENMLVGECLSGSQPGR